MYPPTGSPFGHVPVAPPMKKQRATSTPGRQTDGAETAASTTTTTTAPNMNNNNNTANNSPFDNMVDEAVSRRRMELQKLQERLNRGRNTQPINPGVSNAVSGNTGGGSAANLMSLARSQLGTPTQTQYPGASANSTVNSSLNSTAYYSTSGGVATTGTTTSAPGYSQSKIPSYHHGQVSHGDASHSASYPSDSSGIYSSDSNTAGYHGTNQQYQYGSTTSSVQSSTFSETTSVASVSSAQSGYHQDAYTVPDRSQHASEEVSVSSSGTYDLGVSSVDGGYSASHGGDKSVASTTSSVSNHIQEGGSVGMVDKEATQWNGMDGMSSSDMDDPITPRRLELENLEHDGVVAVEAEKKTNVNTNIAPVVVPPEDTRPAVTPARTSHDVPVSSSNGVVATPPDTVLRRAEKALEDDAPLQDYTPRGFVHVMNKYVATSDDAKAPEPEPSPSKPPSPKKDLALNNNQSEPESAPSSLLSVIRELNDTKRDYAQSLERITELESQLMQQEPEQDNNALPLVSAETNTSPILSHGNGLSRKRSFRTCLLSPVRNTVAHEGGTDQNGAAIASNTMGFDKVHDKAFLFEAAQAISSTFSSDLAEYRILSSDQREDDPFFTSLLEHMDDASSFNQNGTCNHAQVTESVEVHATISPDGSYLIVPPNSMIVHHHKSNPGFETTEKQIDLDDDLYLGNVTYIDSYGNEEEYNLDQVYAEAMSARSNFVTSLITTALALREKARLTIDRIPEDQHAPNQMLQQLPPHQPPTVDIPSVKVDTTEVGIQTDDIPMDSSAPKNLPDASSKDSKDATISKQVDDSGSSDATSALLGFLFTLVYDILWFIFICIPYKSTVWTAKILVFCFVLTCIWLMFADDNGLGLIGGRALGYAAVDSVHLGVY